jgi:hypothetical protein
MGSYSLHADALHSCLRSPASRLSAAGAVEATRAGVELGTAPIEVSFSILRIEFYRPRAVSDGLIALAFAAVGITPTISWGSDNHLQAHLDSRGTSFSSLIHSAGNQLGR